MKTSSRTSEARVAYRTKRRAFKNVEHDLNIGGKALATTAFDSERMGRIRQKGTKPEKIVRRIVTALGHRYRITNRDLPGSPDLANRTRQWTIFVHGCYWHSHQGCSKATVPKKNREFWLAKIEKNRARDRRVQRELRRMGFAVAVVWECHASHPERVTRRLNRLLDRRHC